MKYLLELSLDSVGGSLWLGCQLSSTVAAHH